MYDELILEIAKAIQATRNEYREHANVDAGEFIDHLTHDSPYEARPMLMRRLLPILAMLDRMTEIERLLDATTPAVYLRWQKGGHGDVIATTGKLLTTWDKSRECGNRTPEAALLSLRSKCPSCGGGPSTVTIEMSDGRKFTGTVVPDK